MVFTISVDFMGLPLPSLSNSIVTVFIVNLTDITNYAYNEFEAKLSFLALCYNRVSLYMYIYIYI